MSVHLCVQMCAIGSAARPGKKEGIQGPSWLLVPRTLSFWKLFRLAVSLACRLLP